MAHLETPFYQHNRGQVPVYNKQASMMMDKIKTSKDVWHKGQRLKN